MRYVAVLIVVLCATSAFAQDWVAAMRSVHAQFKGTPNTLGRWGDSITSTSAFFSNLQYAQSNVGPEAAPALNWLRTQMAPGLWSSYGVAHGSTGGSQASWALASDVAPPMRNIDYWLATDKPEMVVILWGTNEAKNGTSVATYRANLTEVVRTCKANGTIPILTTPPPQHNRNMVPYVDAVNAIAGIEQVPVIDYYNAILSRNPGTSWDGYPVYTANPGAYNNNVYAVTTLISGDGIHPSNPSAYTSNFSADALSKNGYNLRNYVTLLKAYEVYQAVIVPEPGTVALLALGSLALLRRRSGSTA